MASAEVYELFNDISDLNYIFLRLQLIYRVQLIERKSVIIFDEIQKAPLARHTCVYDDVFVNRNPVRRSKLTTDYPDWHR